MFKVKLEFLVYNNDS